MKLAHNFLLRRLTVLSVLVLLAVSLVQSARAEGRPFRIVLPAPGRIKGRPTTHEKNSVCLAHWLRDRFRADPRVRIVDQGWSGPVVGNLRSAKWASPPRNFLKTVSHYFPTDAVVEFGSRDEQFVLKLHLTDRPAPAELTIKEDQSSKQFFQKTTDFLLTELDLPAESEKSLAEPLGVPSRTLRAVYLSLQQVPNWKYTTAEPRIEMLKPHLKHVEKSPLVAYSIVKAGEKLTTEHKEAKKPESVMRVVRAVFPFLLGTEREKTAYKFLRRNQHNRDWFEEDFLKMIKPLATDEMDKMLGGPGGLGGGVETGQSEGPGPGSSSPLGRLVAYKEWSRAQRAGALRCLGVLKSEKAFSEILKCASHEDPVVRCAVASALQFFESEKSQKRLRKLATDKDLSVRLAAGYALWKQEEQVEGLLPLARKVLERHSGNARALKIISQTGEKQDNALLWELTRSKDPDLAVRSARRLFELGDVDDEQMLELLTSHSSSVVQAALENLKTDASSAIVERVFVLANGPFGELADVARSALRQLCPDDPSERRRFELRYEHLYVRRQIIRKLAELGDQENIEALEEACGNSHPHARAYALKRLAEISPERAAEAMGPLLTDRHRWIQLRAAAVASKVARPEDAKTIKAAIEKAADKSTRLYLKDALAKAEDKPAPEPARGANRIDSRRLLPSLCGTGPYAPKSPMQLYYQLHLPKEKGGYIKEAHDKGKVMITRCNSSMKGDPARVLFHPYWQDGFWLGMESEFMGRLDTVDGIVLGEETMYFFPKVTWRLGGWRYFCRDAGIDPDRVKGDKSNLNKYEMRAWKHWALERSIEGFNMAADYIKLRFGKLRPGFCVGTFMPHQAGPNPADLDWRFDVAGGYYYHTSNRRMYSRVRRFKTLWPDRHALWLVYGCGAAGGFSAVKYNRKVPENPLSNRRYRGYADAVSVWLAGGMPGWFSSWLFTRRDVDESGTWVGPESIYKESEILDEGIRTCFSGLKEFYRNKDALEGLREGTAEEEGELDLEGDDGGLDIELGEEDKEETEIAQRIEEQKKRLRYGFHYERRRIFDAARLLHSLPPPKGNYPVLLVKVDRAIPGFRLFNRYDFIFDINKLVHLDTSRYRFIGVAGCDSIVLRDETIRALTSWLRDGPNLLYVRGWVTSSNSAEASTAADHDGELREDWPWENSIAFSDGVYRLKDSSTVSKAAGGDSEETELALWQPDGFKGAVLFDNAKLESSERRPILKKVAGSIGIELEIDGPAGIQLVEMDKLTGAAAPRRVPEPLQLKGVEALTGEPGPLVGNRSGAGIVCDNYAGQFVASFHGINVLTRKPIRAAEPIPKGLKVHCDGLVQATSITGAAEVRCTGVEMRDFTEDEEREKWILFGGSEGFAAVEDDRTNHIVYFIRSSKPIFIRQAKP